MKLRKAPTKIFSKKISKKLDRIKNGRTFAPAFENNAVTKCFGSIKAMRMATFLSKVFHIFYLQMCIKMWKKSEKIFSKKFGDMEIGVVPLRSQK
jgi:hypothetical protein